MSNTSNNGESKELLLVQSKVKDFVRSKGLMCSGDLVDALNGAVYEILEKAIHRAGENNRKTARASDV